MLQVTRKKDKLILEIPSEMHLVEHAIREAVKFLADYSITDTSRFRLVLREMLNNAIEHGNHFSDEKKVSLSITYKKPPQPKNDRNTRFLVEMEDEGDGFAYDTLDFSLPEDPKKIRNRGFLLIHALSENITFNEQGNKISVIIACSDEEEPASAGVPQAHFIPVSM